jgi:Mce-associated membrane protein
VSPRRRLEPDESDFFDFTAAPRRRWGMILLSIAASLLIAASLTVGTLMLISHEKDHRTAVNDAAALGYVREFMSGYTSLDPFNANAYVDRILAQGTGEFAKQFKEKENEILIRVAQAEPTQGVVVDAGVQRWTDDGSADILVATKVTSKSPDGKQTIESGNRWVVTATKEGQQWKISQLIQVI